MPTKPGTPAPRRSRSKKRLDLIVRRVRQREFLNAGRPAHPRKELVPRPPGAVFIAGHLARLDRTRQAVLSSKLSNEFSIGIALGSAQLMVEVADMRTPAGLNEYVEERDGIRPTETPTRSASSGVSSFANAD